MTKFLAIVKHEYKKVVLKWSFLIGTMLLPLLAVGFAVVPALIFSIKGEPTRIAIVDPTGNITPRLRENLSTERLAERRREAARDAVTNISTDQNEQLNRTAEQFQEAFIFTEFDSTGRAAESVRSELTSMIIRGEIDAFLIIPTDIEASDARFEFRSRRAGDIVTNDSFRNALNRAVRSQRLANADISEERLAQLSGNVNFDAKGIDDRGEDKDTSGLMIASLIIGLMIYVTLAIYGQAILGAVVEEKETRIAEILFSSARPFELMMGKLVGVGMAGLTQLGIWVLTAAVLISFLAFQSDLAPLVASVPPITPLMIVYFLIFFLVGFFTYAAIFALIGSMVTSVQEGGQFAFPPIMLLLVGFYLSFAVMRDPNSSLSFWASIAPFFSPITMPVRILAEMPPFWHILLAVAVNSIAIAGLVWLTSRVYRVGMLMYGKRATLPEVLKWIRQV
ncbi:MAG: ABC transporter permease [Blastocatellia bacterium]|nr:ABC transporter permease [Blastocatellia bacterium]